MEASGRHTLTIFLVDGLILLFCASGIYHVAQKAGVGFTVGAGNGRVYCAAVHDPAYNRYIHKGEVVRALDGIRVSRPEDVEFILDRRPIGAVVLFEIEGAAGVRHEAIPLKKFYSSIYVFIAFLVGGLFFVIAVFVYVKRPRDDAALYFHWTAVCGAVMISATWGSLPQDHFLMNLVLRTGFSLAYNMVPPLFLHFTLVFPRQKLVPFHKYMAVFYLVAIASTVWDMLMFKEALLDSTVVGFHRYLDAFNLSRLFFVFLVLLGLFNLVHSYRTIGEEPERRKLRWILGGLSIGMLAFIGLWVIPQMVATHGLIPEEGILLLAAIMPLTFGIAIVKYHAMNIDVILNRSAVYTLVMVILLGSYAAIVGIVSLFITQWVAVSEFAISAAAAIVVALLFEPARTRMQRFVDKQFFRVKYDVRQALRLFVEDIRRSLDVQSLADLVVSRTEQLIPVERIGLFLLGENGRLVLLAHRNYDLLTKRAVRFQLERPGADLHVTVALRGKIEPGVPHEIADEQLFKRWGMCVVFTMLSEQDRILGFLVLGEKKGQGVFTVEDVELLGTVTGQVGLALERLQFQEELVLKRAQTKQLEELNLLKSQFVSSVSHELRTPLTSIKMFAELLHKKRNITTRQKKEYLDIIQGESERLTRLINNVLDFAKVERGVQEYHFAEVDLRKLLNDVLRMLDYQLSLKGFEVKVRFPKRPVMLTADADAVAEAAINLVSNAMKYSASRKWIELALRTTSAGISVTVRDKGIGIAANDLSKIFDPFYRSGDDRSRQVGGAGLGLALVKHVMEAHGGRVEVKSALGRGSTFTLIFPHQPNLQRARRKAYETRSRR